MRFRSYIQKGWGNVIKMTPFRHNMHHIKIMLLNAEIFGEQLKTFLLRIRANFYGKPTRNKKVKRFDSKFSFKRKFLY